MSSVYSAAKEIYFKMRKVPVLGTLLMQMSPVAQKVARRIDARKVPRSEIFKQIEVLSQGVVSLQNSVNASLQQTQTQVAEYRTQIDDYRERLEFVRLEVLEQCVSSSKKTHGESGCVKSKILNREKYNAARATRNVRVNIGCGHKPLADYLNVDRRNLPGVDIVAEAADIPFEAGTISEIYVAHLVEHFTQPMLKNTVFPHWLDMLSAQGILKIIVPDMPSMIAAYVHGDMVFSDLKDVTFGAQDYDDDFHYTMFSPQSLQSMLISSGFKYVEFIDENRVNGKCREMEVWARKF